MKFHLAKAQLDRLSSFVEGFSVWLSYQSINKQIIWLLVNVAIAEVHKSKFTQKLAVNLLTLRPSKI